MLPVFTSNLSKGERERESNFCLFIVVSSAIHHLCVSTPKNHLTDVYHKLGELFMEQAKLSREVSEM